MIPKSDYLTYLKEHRKKEYKKMKKEGTLDKIVDETLARSHQRQQDMVEVMLERKPYPENATTLERIQHRAYLEMQAREMEQESIFR